MRHILLVGVQLFGNDAAMLRGVFRYARQRPDWVIHDVSHPFVHAGHEAVRPSGVLANLIAPDVAARCSALGVPVVNLSGSVPGVAGFPHVGVDNAAVGRMAADHLAACGLRDLAWFNHMVAFPFITARGLAFAERVRELDGRTRAFNEDIELTAHGSVGPENAPHTKVAKWLVDLPKPCGVFATTDHGGRELCWLCRQLGLHVPEDVAVVGVDDFEFICETSFPPLSSVRLPNEEIGYRAAEMLDAQMDGRPVSANILFPPSEVHVRQSSDVVAVQDRAVAAALAYIRRHATDRLDVPAVARAAGLNRRALERRFRQALDRSVLQEIHAARVAKARSLLIDTSLPVGDVATQAGFRDAQHIDLVFRKTTGQSPSAFRRSARDPSITVP